MILFGHPFSSYTRKALIALYEMDISFKFRVIGPDDPSVARCVEEARPYRHLFPLGAPDRD
jgi:glutathione S-transferase